PAAAPGASRNRLRMSAYLPRFLSWVVWSSHRHRYAGRGPFLPRPSMSPSPAGKAAKVRPCSVHRTQPLVEIIGGEVHAVGPRDGREPVIEREFRKPLLVSQRLELLPVQLVGEIDHTFLAIVEFQPNLVVT